MLPRGLSRAVFMRGSERLQVDVRYSTFVYPFQMERLVMNFRHVSMIDGSWSYRLSADMSMSYTPFLLAIMPCTSAPAKKKKKKKILAAFGCL